MAPNAKVHALEPLPGAQTGANAKVHALKPLPGAQTGAISGDTEEGVALSSPQEAANPVPVDGAPRADCQIPARAGRLAPQVQTPTSTEHTAEAADCPAETSAAERLATEDRPNDESRPKATDTHAVGWEGGRNRIIVVAKKMTLQRWAAGSDERDASFEGLQQKYNTTIIFTLLTVASHIVWLLMLVHDVKDKRLYWLTVPGGIFNWLNMLGSRNPRLLRQLVTNFDAIFTLVNMVVAYLCLSASFDWDERAAAVLLVILPTQIVILWGDATMSDFEFKVRRAFYLFAIFGFVTVLVIDMGRLIKDVESVVVAFDSTDGVYLTTAEDVALANTTNDSPFMVTRHVYLRSTGSTRISFATIYLIYFFVKSMTAPEECLILKDAPGRTVGVREEEEADNACQEATLSGPNAEEQTPVGEQAQPARRTLIRLNAIDEANETFAYDDVELDDESREDVEMLRDEEEAVVLMPAYEYVIRHGPERTVLYFLCCNLWLSEKINGAFEEIKLVSTLLLTTILLGVATTAKLVPFELRWIAALGMLDSIRKVFKMNVEAVGLVLRELDFHIPFWANVVATYFASSSLGHEPGCVVGLIAYASMVSVVLLADADLSPRAVEGKRSRVVTYIVILIGALLFYAPLAFGLLVYLENRLLDYEFLRNSGQLESISLSLRFASYPLPFICKAIWKTLRHPGRAIVVKFPLRRHCMPKSELRGFLRRRQQAREELTRQRSLSMRSQLSLGSPGPPGASVRGLGEPPGF